MFGNPFDIFTFDSPLDFIFTTFVPLGIALFSIFAACLAAKNLILTYFRFKMQVEDVSQERIPLPEGAEDIEGELWTLGFEPIGILRIKLFGSRTPVHEWLYAIQDGRIYAEVAPLGLKNKPAITGFYTRFPDDAMIITNYPVGENIVTPNFQSRFAAYSLEAAYEHHVQQITRWEKVHGAPVIVRTVSEILQSDDVYRQLHRRRNHRRLLIIQSISLVIALASFITASMVLVSTRTDNASFQTVSWLAFFAIIPIELVAGARIEDQVNKPPGAVDA
jgi:hypothetical protein